MILNQGHVFPKPMVLMKQLNPSFMHTALTGFTKRGFELKKLTMFHLKCKVSNKHHKFFGKSYFQAAVNINFTFSNYQLSAQFLYSSTICVSPLSTCILYGCLQRVTIPEAVVIQFVLLKMSSVLLETC